MGMGREACILRAGRIGIMSEMGCGVVSGMGREGRKGWGWGGGGLMLWLVWFGLVLFDQGGKGGKGAGGGGWW